MPTDIIEVKNLTVGYDDTIILEDISFSVHEGEIFIILGGSGSGKSTLLRQMVGLQRPFRGSILIEGVDMVQVEGADKISLLNKIGVSYQNNALFGSMNLIENVRLPLEEFTDLPESAINAVAAMKLKAVGLQGFEKFMPSETSGGMQKRTAIARAMALDPKILFLDEPSSGLDPITAAEMDEMILNLSKGFGMTFVIVTHELDSIFKIAGRIIMLDKNTKTIIAEGDPRVLRDSSHNERVRQFFNRQLSPHRL